MTEPRDADVRLHDDVDQVPASVFELPAEADRLQAALRGQTETFLAARRARRRVLQVGMVAVVFALGVATGELRHTARSTPVAEPTR